MKHLHINNLWINGLLQTFEQLGLDAAELSRGMEAITAGQLAPGCQLDLVDARTLWHRAVKLAADPLLGVKVGFQQNPRSSGVIFPLALHSPSVRAALQHIVNFQTLISESGCYRIHVLDVEGRDCIECEYVPVPSSVSISPQQVMSVVASTLNLIKLISSDDICAQRVYVPAEMDTVLIAQELDCVVESRAGNLSMIFATDKLDDPIFGRDEHLYQLSLSYAEGLLRAKRVGQHFLDSIKGYIDVASPAQVGVDEVAAKLGLHRRALQRNLAEQGTSFRQLKESLLKERSLALLISLRLNVDTIAETLGYSDASTFHRAFKAWFHVTPKQFRDQIGS
ncbi:MAG: helix-turn-helix domain-containing protein [Arenicella sp.]|nr:helix-turn-helix domain-containing protein [Arenicella sp.]